MGNPTKNYYPKKKTSYIMEIPETILEEEIEKEDNQISESIILEMNIKEAFETMTKTNENDLIKELVKIIYFILFLMPYILIYFLKPPFFFCFNFLLFFFYINSFNFKYYMQKKLILLK